MQLIRGLSNLSHLGDALAKGCVLTIGNFDGVHLGHQLVLKTVKKQAQAQKLPGLVMVFEPSPIEYFNPDNAPVRLMNFREKAVALHKTDIDYVLVCRFDEHFASLTAKEFVKTILVDALNAKHIVVGDDFCFGQKRQGNFAFLNASGKQFGFSVNDMPTHVINAQRVSSTRIRDALKKPNLAAAKALLGKPFCFDGRVIHGQKLGRKIGFRTLNLNPKRLQMPVSGVFAVTVGGISDQPVAGVANVGVRPTVKGLRPSIEVHLFDWNTDIYGQHVQVALHHFIRPEMKFNGLDALVTQIKKDAETAKTWLNQHDYKTN